MKDLTIGKRITSALGLLALVTLGLGLFCYRLLLPIDEQAQSMKVDALPGTITILEISIGMQANNGSIHGHVFAPATEKPVFEAAIKKHAEVINQAVARYEPTITTAIDRKLFDDFKARREAFVASFKKALALSNAGQAAEAQAEYQQKTVPAEEQALDALGKLVELNRGNAEQAMTSINAGVSRGKTGIVAGIGAALAAAVLLSFFIVRGINRVLIRVSSSLGEGADQVASAAAQVSASSQSLAEGASEQAASLEETSASLEEMSSMTKRNAESAVQAKELATQTRAAADTGAADMTEMKQAMDAIKSSSDDISKIIKTIDEIAFQTNILALNAAVEAARAGEAGMGFAVVAEEVRNLAQRSAQSAKETAAKIEDSMKRSEHGVQITGKVAKSLGEIVERTRKMDSLVAEIATASNEQTQGTGQVNTAIREMDKVTQANAGSAEETAAAAQELSAQAVSMQSAVTELRMLVGGSASNVSPHLPPKAAPAVKSHVGGDGQHRELFTHRAPARGQQKLTVTESIPSANGHHDEFFKST